METIVYTRMPYCSLCGEKFNLRISFRSVVLVNQHNDPILTELLNFQGRDSAIVLPRLNIYILASDNNQTAYRLAPSIHNLCWTAIDRPPSLHFVYNLGLIMNPLLWAKLPQSIYSHYQIMSIASYSLSHSPPALEAKDTTTSSFLASTPSPLYNDHRANLNKLIDDIGNLPPELTSIIWEFIPPSPVRCLLSLCAAKTIWPAIDTTTASATVQLSGEISLYFISTLDGTYISGICIGDILCGYRSNWCTRYSTSPSVVAFAFTLGLYGLRKIDMLSKSTTKITSSKAKSQEFLGIIYAQTAQSPWIEVQWDGMKISHFKWVPASENQEVFGHDFIWVSPWLPSQLYTLSANSFYDWPRSCDFTSQGKRFMAHVPLHRDGHYLCGLTAFCSSRGFVGLGVHFNALSDISHTVSWYGQQQGCPVHVQLARSEHLTSISVVWDRASKSYLAITTDRGRNLTLGPYISPAEIQLKTLFSSDCGDSFGLYYEILPGLPNFTSLGVVCRSYSSSLISKHHIKPNMPYHFSYLGLLHTCPWSSFTSRASLTNVKKLKACYLGPRCTGMLLIYNDGGTSTLGQWYECTSLQAGIVEMDYMSDHVLRFSLVKAGRYQYVSRVDSLPQSIPFEANPEDLFNGDDIIWLYSPNCDIVLRVPT